MRGTESHETRIPASHMQVVCRDGGRTCELTARPSRAELQTTRTFILQVQEGARDGGEGGEKQEETPGGRLKEPVRE